MSSVTGNVTNNTNFAVTVSSGGASHGDNPTILKPTVPAHTTLSSVFVANSSGAGVEGTVILKGNGVQWSLNYDDPVVGSNSGSVNSPSGYSGSCQVGGGDDAIFGYTIGQN